MADRSADDPRGRLILALDVPDLDAGRALLDRVEGRVGLVKVGLELFTACGPPAVEVVAERGLGVFLDLKLHDIPATVAGAVRSARSLGVSMLTVHTGGGREMLARAAEEAGEEIRVLGVTLLTSLGAEDLPGAAIVGTPQEVVLTRARLAAEAGLGGIVCSPREVVEVRGAIGEALSIVTPGIRPKGAAAQDQKRAATPESAIGDGADYLVVGRPIRGADDPGAAADAIVREIAAALERR
jgi:orotidine-5'-phosphate decarboxylase